MVREASVLVLSMCSGSGIDTPAGLDSIGIYRLSGTTSKVQALKNALDKGESLVLPAWLTRRH